ncbi:hypothetical protein ABZV91_23310 [Nocardia sp. NPDC004568]|uniref:hypothetical protein n=1 Tax=Nocardia sp. NPDC004568 TaxID=3154551 RepID=UPI0033A3B5E5
MKEVSGRRARPAVKHSSSESYRYTTLAHILRKVISSIPDVAEMSNDANAATNMVDMAICASGLCLRRGRESLALEILKEVVALNCDELPARFLAWQAGGVSALKYVDTEISAPQTKEFVRRLESGYYKTPMEDLSRFPTTPEGKPRLVVVLCENLLYMDFFTLLEGTVYFLGRINEPELAVSLGQARKEFLPSAYAMLEHLVKLGKSIRSFYYKDIKIQVFNDLVFGPAIDTFFFIKVLHKFIDRHGGLPRSDCVLELGAGSGAILYTLTRRLSNGISRQRIHAIATDISSHAIAHSQELFSDVVESGRALLTTITDPDSLRRVLEQYGPGSVDILTVNPPYIPRTLVEQLIAEGKDLMSPLFDDALEEYVLSVRPNPRPPNSSEDIAHRATEDLELYVQALLTAGPELLDSRMGIMFLLVSSTSEEVVRLLFDKSPLCAVKLDRRARVPLEIPELTSGALRAELLDLPGVDFDVTDGRYPLRHTLTVYALFHPQSVWSEELNG